MFYYYHYLKNFACLENKDYLIITSHVKENTNNNRLRSINITTVSFLTTVLTWDDNQCLFIVNNHEFQLEIMHFGCWDLWSVDPLYSIFLVESGEGQRMSTCLSSFQLFFHTALKEERSGEELYYLSFTPKFSENDSLKYRGEKK